jgi:hypothetical protein
MARKGKIGSADSEEPSANALEANPSEPNIVVWSDPEWEPALHALEAEKPDPRPLAKLLCSGKPVPEAVATRLGELLDPPWGNKGPRLIPSVSKRYSGQANLQPIKTMMSVKHEIEKELQRFGKLEAAIEKVGKRRGLSRSYLMKAWKLDMKTIVLRMSRLNPQPFLSPHESDKS